MGMAASVTLLSSQRQAPQDDSFKNIGSTFPYTPVDKEFNSDEEPNWLESTGSIRRNSDRATDDLDSYRPLLMASIGSIRCKAGCSIDEGTNTDKELNTANSSNDIGNPYESIDEE